MNELRLGWALLLALTALAVLPDAAGLPLFAAGAAPALPGTLALARERSAGEVRARFAEVLRAPRARGLLLAIVALLALAALVLSPSAALCLATALGSLLIWTLGRRGAGAGVAVLEQTAALGGALVLVLFPLELLFRLPPVARQFGLPAERARQVERYDRLWERNIFRFRSRHESVARRAGVHRVIVLGDSFSWGLLVPDSDSIWPARLERELGGGAEVVNMAQRGWTTANEAEFLRRLGWQFQPDLVIVQFYLNDAYASGPNLGFEEGRRVYLLPEQFWRGYIQGSAVSAFVSRAVNGLLFGLLFRRDENEGRFDEREAGWAQLRAALREMGDSARARRTPVLFVLFPDLTPGAWTPADHPSRPIHDRVAEQARAAGMDVLDLITAYAAEGGDWKRWWATPYDSHPNEAAHAVAAAAVARHLRERRLLAGAEPLP
ncbi:MAG TPA: SGNH/GDSL hydrolase family protein [Gemmatimonadales bacterium]|nr:SGNH/GDSL hydrolase family protein [Gemmatimonadales bacterium]